MKKTRCINFYAGPGAGKSTVAAGLFSIMKFHGINCELVSEYAKDLTWERSSVLKGDGQLKILGEQSWRLLRLSGKVDYIITDSPILLNTFYGDPATAHPRRELAWGVYE